MFCNSLFEFLPIFRGFNENAFLSSMVIHARRFEDEVSGIVPNNCSSQTLVDGCKYLFLLVVEDQLAVVVLLEFLSQEYSDE